ncbi:unnamed protein product [Phytomonas sp. EM1]|nr:unnamed protein product [Phytomonas sp. EM1]|eukprot:CCW62701.1 unnamed protein product [Phytomonas sp. isolate EM1]
MISNQCRAQCRCSHCEHNSTNTQRTLAVGSKKVAACDTNDSMKVPSLSKDEMYMKYLQSTLNKRALMVSSKNASKFIPDEQIVSSLKRREAKEAAIASQQFPLRRRDRLEELLILEHKMRLKEEARLRKERLKLGILDDHERVMTDGEVCDSSKDATTQVPVSPDQNSVGDRSTPLPRCSAEHDLNGTLCEIKDILEEEANAPPGKELSHQHIFKLHQLVQRHDKKSREQQRMCPQQSHLCNHCFDVEVQARHLCPSASLGSVAYKETGKVINPEEGIRLGTDSQRGPGGTYTADDVTRFMASNMRLRDYNPHPYGTGVVFMPLSATANHGNVKSKTNGNHVKFEPTFNNNIAPEEPVVSEMQYPGSTYNVYDEPTLSGKCTKNDAGTITSVKQYAVDPENNTTENSNFVHRNEVEAKTVGDKSKLEGKSSSSFWRTTNQARDMDMERFLKFQKMLKDNSRQVYESTAPRNAVGTGF